jgi:hypothetical protein
METNFDFNMFHLMVLGLGMFFYAAFPVERLQRSGLRKLSVHGLTR